MDAVFGLPRRKKAGVSYRKPLHGQLFFADQEKVDNFVSVAQKSNVHVEVRT